jgi:hypothetical protein
MGRFQTRVEMVLEGIVKRCRVTNERVEDDECDGICSVCDNAIEPVTRIKRKERGQDDGRGTTNYRAVANCG